MEGSIALWVQMLNRPDSAQVMAWAPSLLLLGCALPSFGAARIPLCHLASAWPRHMLPAEMYDKHAGDLCRKCEDEKCLYIRT